MLLRYFSILSVLAVFVGLWSDFSSLLDRYFPGDEAGESDVVVPDEVEELETVVSDVPVVDEVITEKVESVNILIFDATNYVHVGFLGVVKRDISSTLYKMRG